MILPPAATTTKEIEMEKISQPFELAAADRPTSATPKADRALGETELANIAAGSATAKPPVQPS
jgi:hypothetical protein